MSGSKFASGALHTELGDEDSREFSSFNIFAVR